MDHVSNPLRDAEAYLHAQIPLTRAMGLRVRTANDEEFVVAAPVTLNCNHMQTAFGGSINAVATLAGYGLLWLALRDEDAHVVIRESSIRFVLPICETISAICDQPPEALMKDFKNTLRRYGKARMNLQVRVEEKGKLAAEWQGTFVAVRSAVADAGSAPPAAETLSATAVEQTRSE